MKCPECGRLDHNNRVVDSRPYKHTIRRKRVCSHCSYRWHTYEATELEFTSDRNRNKYIPWSPGEEVTAVSMYQAGGSKAEIGRVLGRDRMSVSRKLDKLTASGEYFVILEESLKSEVR
ncbi:hypothetical protein ACQKM1_22555 [Peribacillus frigoritolerans]|uniref:NrdR family transcriptional regulator n=1 Tax=Peribacillus frigoritolerans TaxID=450367 RepID=UPI003D034AB2